MRYITKVRKYDYKEMMKDSGKLLIKYPFLQEEIIGASVLGRKLPLIRWGEGENYVLIVGSHHGNEWITSLLCMRFLEILCREFKEENAEYKYLYKKASYYIIPMLNPDGVGLSLHGLSSVADNINPRLVRANGGSEDFIGKWQANANGVDLNHNYDAGFEKGRLLAAKQGILGPGPTRWSGASPESEPESAALALVTRNLMPKISVAYHSQGEVIYADFEGKASEEALKIAQKMSRLSGYHLDSTQGVESFSGYKDWIIDKLHLPAYTVEVGLGANPLPLSQFNKILKDNVEMLLFLGWGEKNNTCS